tara:strand:+ start:56 stop:445 length:390 start_codon:yes stop_codon:yes gene_type:complete
MLDAFGKHLIVDFKDGNNLNDSKIIQEFINDLVSRLNMTKYGDTHIQYFGETPEVKGYSFFQLIHESNISGHFCGYDYYMNRDGKSWNNKGAGYIDIFSCKDYDHNNVIDCIEKFFSPKSIVFKIIDRI